MHSFLLLHYKKYKHSLAWVSGIAVAIITAIWNYDLKQLTPSGSIEHQQIFQIRIFLTLLSTSLYLLALLLLTFLHYKKDMEPITLTQEDRTRYLKILGLSEKTSISTSAPALDEIKINILTLLFSHDKLTTEDIVASQNIQLQSAQYHLEELSNLGMVKYQRFSEQVPGGGPFGSFPGLRRYSAWIIMQAGRKYLIENKLVS